jgi:predicted enzyme related to lactoylglutathione lyase
VAKLNYLELPVDTTERAKSFYSEAFGWTFTDFGPTYAATIGEHADLGFQADAEQKTAALLPVIEVDDLDVALAAIVAAGGAVTLPIFAFPGGRRFHFRDPDGHELAAMQPG